MTDKRIVPADGRSLEEEIAFREEVLGEERWIRRLQADAEELVVISRVEHEQSRTHWMRYPSDREEALAQIRRWARLGRKHSARNRPNGTSLG